MFVNKNGLGRFPEFRDQGVGGSNPLSPTNIFLSFQELADRPIITFEPDSRSMSVMAGFNSYFAGLAPSARLDVSVEDAPGPRKG